MQGPLLFVSADGLAPHAGWLSSDDGFPLVEAAWARASDALLRLRPAAVVMSDLRDFAAEGAQLAQTLARIEPYTPAIALLEQEGDVSSLPARVLPFATAAANAPQRLRLRLQNALRTRALHATVLRRQDAGGSRPAESLRSDPLRSDPLRDAAVLLAGRGGSYPGLSLAAGMEMGVVGALSIEAAAKHLNTRDIDGIILGEGFTPRVLDAFLTVLGEDSRFRHLPVVIAGNLAGASGGYELANLEYVTGDAAAVIATARPFVRQHAFAARLARILRSLDAGGLLDARSGLLTAEAFASEMALATNACAGAGAALTVARFGFDEGGERASYDAARLLSRLMRRVDFGVRQPDGSIIVAFPQTDMRSGQQIARRLASVLKQTALGTSGKRRLQPAIAVEGLKPGDTADAVLARLMCTERRAAS